MSTKTALAFCFSICIIVFFPLHANSQVPAQYKPIVDSLQNQLKHAKEDSSKVKTLMELLNQFIDFDMEAAERYGVMANNLSKKINYEFGAGRSFYSLGIITMNLGRHSKADSFLNLSHDVFQRLDIPDRIAMINNARGNLAFMQGNYWLASDFYTKATMAYEAINDTTNALIVYQNLIATLGETKNYDKAIPLAIKVVGMAERGQDTLIKWYAIESLIVNHTATGDFKSAAQYIPKALQFANSTGDYNVATDIYGSVGNYYYQQSDFPTALSFFTRALNKAKLLNSAFLTSYQMKNVGTTLLKLNRLAEAKSMLDQAVELGNTSINTRTIYEASLALSDYYKKTGDHIKAHQYLQQHLQLKDSILDAETRHYASFLEAQYESTKKEKEIAQLRTTTALKELEVVKRNRILLIGSISAAALLLIVGLLYRNARHRQTISAKEQKLQHEQIKFLERQQQVVSLQSMINGQEAERTRIAKDLHDGLGGLFSTIKMHFNSLQNDDAQLKTNMLFTKSYGLIDNASVELRRIAHNMMPEVLMRLGIIQAVEELCNNINAAKLMNISLQAYGMEQRLSTSTEIMLYRIIQELLNNIMKHSGATEAIIQFNRENERLAIIVEDNGKGFSAQDATEGSHAGIDTIKSRINYLNGKLNIDSQKGVGTTVLMEFLINEKEPASVNI